MKKKSKQGREMATEERIAEIADIQASIIAWLWPHHGIGDNVARSLLQRLAVVKTGIEP